MKRSLARAAIVVLALLAGGASVWEGSAVIGGAGDFPGEGLYGACNSFPRDTPVEVRNLETGKVITVIISRTVDNPGVFIALSPKAAAELGMRSGAAARVRAVALSVAQAAGTMPVARAGESSDPDLNPKVFVARDKAAAAARTTSAAAVAPAAPAPAVAAAPAAPAVPAAQPAPAQPAAIAAPAAVAPPAAATPTPAAPAAPAPSDAAPVISEAASKVAAQPAVTAAPIAAEKPVADPYPVEVPEIAPPGEPRPEPLALALPVPDQVPLPVQASVPTAHAFPAFAAESYGGSLPKPRKSGGTRVALPEPAVPVKAVAAATAPGAAVAPVLEKPNLDYIGSPLPAAPATAAGLPEPLPQPDVLPEAVLSRIIAPRSGLVASVLDEAAAPAGEEPGPSAEALALQRPTVPGGSGLPELAEPAEKIGVQAALPEGPEAIAFERPRLAPAAPDLALAAPAPAEKTRIGPEATVLERPSAGEEAPGAELADAEVPSPQELVAAERPLPQAGEALAELGEPGYPEPPATAEAIAENRLTAEPAAVAALTDPEPPSPLESLSPESPAKAGGSELLALLDEPEGFEPAAEKPQPLVAEAPAVEAVPVAEELPVPQEPVPAESVAVERPVAAEPVSPVQEPLEIPAVAAAEPSEPAQPAPAAAESASEAPLAQPEPAVAAPAVAEPAVAVVEPVAPSETEISLEPTSPRPPAESPATKPATTPAPAVPAAPAPAAPATPAAPAPTAPAPAAPAMAGVQLPESVAAVASLAKGSYYVQIGVYGTSDSLRTAVGGFVPAYPVAAEKVAVKGADAYRLYIGPLTRDESGVVLMRIKALGFKDAFVKKGS